MNKAATSLPYKFSSLYFFQCNPLLKYDLYKGWLQHKGTFAIDTSK
jgi:hypothetical protein